MKEPQFITKICFSIASNFEFNFTDENFADEFAELPCEVGGFQNECCPSWEGFLPDHCVYLSKSRKWFEGHIGLCRALTS